MDPHTPQSPPPAQTQEELVRELGAFRAELARRDEELRLLYERGLEAERVRTRLLANVSHELRTPLSALVLQVERMRRDAAELSPHHRDAVARMRSATHRLTGLVDSLLEHARFEAGGISLRPEPVDPARVAAEVIEDLRPQAARKGLALSGPEPGGPSRVDTDPRLLRLVLLNLVSNAIKFTDAGGVGVSVEAAEGEHRLVVRDTGRGIAPEDQARIFEPFEQLETIARKHTPGVGLGLALVREVVSALGGRISVESAPGEGSTFLVAIPTARRAGARNPHAPAAHERTGAAGARRGGC
jgi:signal transduction histidine kinase